MASRVDGEPGVGQPVLIVGAGGHGRVVLDILRAARAAGSRYEPVGFVDADPALNNTLVGGLPVFGPLNVLAKLRQRQDIAHAVVAIGDNRVRRLCAGKLVAAGYALVNAIHPSAVISSEASLGVNVVIGPGAIICTAVRIDDSALINTGALIDHECRVGVGAHVAPGARLAGRVAIGEGAFVGLGASVIQCLSVGAEAVVGAGAVVIRDVDAATTVVGVPAVVFRRAVVTTANV